MRGPPVGKRRAPPEPVKFTLGELISGAFSDAEGLRDELQEWHDNLPENFQNGDKGSALEEAIGQIEAAQQPDVPEDIADDQLTFTPAPRKRRHVSRADRLAECSAMLVAAKEHLEEKIRNEPEHKDAADWQELVDDCDDAIAEWDNVEFPGMY